MRLARLLDVATEGFGAALSSPWLKQWLLGALKLNRRLNQLGGGGL